MKPKANGHPVDSIAGDDDISLYKAYESLGLLITESRIPDRSVKGRRDGTHIPQGHAPHKLCTDEDAECEKVRRYKEVISKLCYNGIPLCVEVLLCPHCEIGASDSCSEHVSVNFNSTHDVGSAHSDTYVLLEQWTIQQVYTRADGNAQSLQNLSNAVRSQLCFSQLSAWLQMSLGATPKHVFYRLTAPGEWFVHKFVMSPQRHNFADAVLGRSKQAVRVTLSSLPRTSLTPYEISIANRDQLFAVKDAAPLQRKSRSSFNPVEVKEKECGGHDVLAGVGSDRTHTRSKSVRGMQYLTGQKSADERHHPRVQRRLQYSDDCSISPSGQSAAEQLASFPSLSTNSITNLEHISCSTGANCTKTSPPTRLSITGSGCTSLKSPKVLFTRTSARDSLLAVPPITRNNDLSSQFSSFEFSSDVDTAAHEVTKPHFNIGDVEEHLCEKSTEEMTTASTTCTVMSGDNLRTRECDCSSSSEPKVTRGSKCSSMGGLECRGSIGSNGHTPQTVEQSNGTSLTNPPIKSSAARVSNGVGKNNGHVDRRKSRKELDKASNGSHATDAPVNKKLQNIKHPLNSRSRLFKQRPLQSSPAPVKRMSSNNFGYDESITNIEAIKNALSCTSLSDHNGSTSEGDKCKMTLSASAPVFSTASSLSHNSLLGNFEESLLNGRIEPAGVVNGFTVEIGASGSFCPKHVSLPVEAYFFNSLSDNDAPSPYLGYVDLSEVSQRGYQIPRKGTLQITLFYPNHKVNKMFVITYDLTDMPSKSHTFIRQKTVYAPCEDNDSNQQNCRQSSANLANHKLPTYLRYLIHLRLLSTKTNKIFLHTDIRLIYARDKFEFDSRVASYELRSFIESPSNPKYSAIK